MKFDCVSKKGTDTLLGRILEEQDAPINSTTATAPLTTLKFETRSP